MAPEKVCIIVGASAVLHNIALQLHKPMEDGEVDELADVDPCHGPQQGLSLRDHICQTFFWLRFSYAVLNSVFKLITSTTLKSAPVIKNSLLLLSCSVIGPQFQK